MRWPRRAGTANFPGEEIKAMFRKHLPEGAIQDALYYAGATAYALGFVAAVEAALSKLVY